MFNINVQYQCLPTMFTINVYYQCSLSMLTINIITDDSIQQNAEWHIVTQSSPPYSSTQHGLLTGLTSRQLFKSTVLCSLALFFSGWHSACLSADFLRCSMLKWWWVSNLTSEDHSKNTSISWFLLDILKTCSFFVSILVFPCLPAIQ